LKRVLGISASAGLDQAIRFAKSDDLAKRDFASDLLAQFNSPEARSYLEMLAKEPPNSGGASAKAWLYVLSTMSLNPPAEFAEH